MSKISVSQGRKNAISNYDDGLFCFIRPFENVKTISVDTSCVKNEKGKVVTLDPKGYRFEYYVIEQELIEFYPTPAQPQISTKVFCVNSNKEINLHATSYPHRKDFIFSHKTFSNEDESIFKHFFFTGTGVVSYHILQKRHDE